MGHHSESNGGQRRRNQRRDLPPDPAAEHDPERAQSIGREALRDEPAGDSESRGLEREFPDYERPGGRPEDESKLPDWQQPQRVDSSKKREKKRPDSRRDVPAPGKKA